MSESESEERCSICLGRLKDPCSPTTCGHVFCTNCLSIWMTVKRLCPICRRPVTLIQRTLEVKAMDPDQAAVELDSSFRRPLNAMPFWFAENPFRNLYIVPRREINGTIRESGMETQIMRIYNIENGSPLAINMGITNLIWRRLIYVNNFYALPLEGCSAHDIDAAYFSRHPLDVQRVMRFFNRELKATLGEGPTATAASSTVEGSLIHIDLDSSLFRILLHPFLIETTQHFIHEMINFARYSLDVMEYDQRVQYTANQNGAEAATGQTTDADTASTSGTQLRIVNQAELRSHQTQTDGQVATATSQPISATGAETSMQNISSQAERMEQVEHGSQLNDQADLNYLVSAESFVPLEAQSNETLLEPQYDIPPTSSASSVSIASNPGEWNMTGSETELRLPAPSSSNVTIIDADELDFAAVPEPSNINGNSSSAQEFLCAPK